MVVQFFDFGNSETFHFFKWVSESGRVDASALIQEAYRRAESSPTLGEESLGICYSVREQLTALLLVTLDNVLPFVPDDDACVPGAVSYSDESLWEPLLAFAAARIDCERAAHALLLQAGKWNPQDDIPEIEGGEEPEGSVEP